MKKILSIILVMAMILTLAACGNQTKKDEPKKDEPKQQEGIYKPGTYKASAEGYNKKVPIEVEVKVSAEKIEDIKVVKQEETEGLGAVAAEKLPQKMLEAQSAKVDVMASATVSSKAIIAAVEEALKQASTGKAPQESKKEEKKDEKKEEELSADVIIVGSGGAGLSAAIEANAQGKSVIIVEKAELTGGNTTRATGGMNAAKTVYQDKNKFQDAQKDEILNKIATVKEKYPNLVELANTVEKQLNDYLAKPEGYFDSKELFLLDTMVGGKGINNPELAKTLVSKSSEAIEWLKTMGMELTDVGSFGGASVQRIHRPLVDGKTKAVGSYLVPMMTKIVEEKQIKIVFGKEVKELLVENNKVVGVKSDGLTVKGKSIILATGGFGANLEKVVEIKPELKGFVTTNAPQMTGDGIWMAQKVGADVVDLDQIQIHPTVEQSTASLITEGVRGDGAILVNQEGKRFINEVETRDIVSAAEVAQPGGYAYLIFDDAMVQKSGPLQNYLKKGFVKEAKSVEELAKVLEIQEKNLVETMKKWNENVVNQKDEEFGRTSFVTELKTAPFYAIKLSPGVHHTMGGLRINEKAEVLDKSGNPIPNLFAAGEVTGGVHGANRLGGNAVADIIVFGRIAGESAAKNAK